MAQIKTSEQFRLHWRDVVKALLIATLTPVLLLVQQSVAAGEMIFDWKHLSMAAIGGFVAYLLKNFLTPSQVILTGEDVTKAVANKSEAENKA